jgi:uncharacterized protein (DUF1697 family)
MRTYVAFLRAINVGGHIVKMDRLRALFEGFGFQSVQTFIASGNVIFESKSADAEALERRVERDLEKALGYAVGTFLRSTTELSAIATYEPFEAARIAKAHALHVNFFKQPLSPEVCKKILALRSASEDFDVNGRELYWLTAVPMSESIAARPLLKAIGDLGTMRNVTTVRKLAAKHCR